VRAADFQLTAEDIVDAAVSVMREQGLDAVSMRSVSARLGVSPVPLYSRVGNKEALLDAVSDHLLGDLAPTLRPRETWSDYALRWSTVLRDRLREAPDSRLILGPRRAAYVAASRPLVEAMRAGGLTADVAVRGCRLVMWATVGFVAMEGKPVLPSAAGRRDRLAGSDPAGVTAEESDELFALQIRYLIEGIARDTDDTM
jgi:TetR/AcrR family transcriptional regulator, tetracycline repressor protein